MWQRQARRALLALWLTTPAATTLGGPPSTQPAAHDWPMWGGSPRRNGVSSTTGIPHTWNIETGQNIKWLAPLGSYSYAGPVITDGRIYVGTNNAGSLRPGIEGDKGCLLCLDQKTGKLLWQATHDKLAGRRENDWPEQGVASSPYVEGDRVYYVSNRCELVCADARGFHDNENDGPLRNEKRSDKQDADFVWLLDMIGELGVYPHNLAACSPVGAGDLIFVCTSNGVDEEHEKPPAPDAPSFIAVHKKTGKVAWKRSDPGRGILHGQWSSPAYAEIAGQEQVIFGAGDGWCYAYAARTGKLLWKFDLNPRGSRWKAGGTGTKSSIVATPVVAGKHVFLAVGDDPESAPGPGHLYAIDATKRGDVTESGKLWHLGGDNFGRSISSVVVADGLVYAAELDGYLSCLDAKTGKQHWRHDLWAGVWGSPCVVDGKVMIGTTDGEVVVLEHGQGPKELARNDVHHAIYTTPVALDGVLYIVTQKNLYAIETGAKRKQ